MQIIIVKFVSPFRRAPVGVRLKGDTLKLETYLFMTPSLIIANFFNGRIDIDTVIIGNNIFLTIVTGTAGTFLLIAISKLIEDKSVFLSKMINWEKYSNGASIIVGLNLLIITILLKLLIYIYPSFELNTIYGLIISFAIMKLCYPLIVFCLKYCPMLIGRKKYTSVKQI